MFGCPSPSSGKGNELQQHSISCRSGRGEAPLSFRRAPRGLASRRCRVEVHHAKAIAQSYPRDFGSPAFTADNSSEDALAVSRQRIREDALLLLNTTVGARSSHRVASTNNPEPPA